MKATIVNYIDQNHNECLSVGNTDNYEKIKKTSIQIIRVLDIEVSEEDWYQLGDLTQEELIDCLIETLDYNRALHIN